MRTLIALVVAVVLVPVAGARAAPPRPGDLAITEIAANPALPEPAAEFVVVDNAGSSAVLLDGVRLTDAARAVRGVVPADTSLDPGQRIALQPPGATGVYGCEPTPHRALLTAWAGLNNDGDSVVLEAGDGTELDRVAYPRDAFAVDGPSLRLDRGLRVWRPSTEPATPCRLAAPRPGTVRLSAALLTASERAPSVTVELRRDGGTNGRVSVPWATRDGGATAGSDYARSGGVVVLAAGQESATIAVPLLDDPRDEGDETFTIALAAPGGGAILGEPSRTAVVVHDDDPPAPAPAPSVLATPVFAPTGPLTAPPATVQPAPAPPVIAAAVPARVSLAVAPWQRALRRDGIAVAVGCDRDCAVHAAGRIALGRGRFARLAAPPRELRAQVTAVVRLRVPARQLRAVRRALRSRGSLLATVVAKPAGGIPVEHSARVR
jgi:hypothetical protein